MKNWFSFLYPGSKYVLTTERTKESVFRTLHRVTGKKAYPVDHEFYGTVQEESFRIRYNIRYCTDLQRVSSSLPSLMDGVVQEENGKTMIRISTSLPTSCCITFGIFYLASCIGFLLGLIFTCAGDFKDGIPLLLMFGILPVVNYLLMWYSVSVTEDRAIKRLSHLLFAEVTSRPVEE